MRVGFGANSGFAPMMNKRLGGSYNQTKPTGGMGGWGQFGGHSPLQTKRGGYIPAGTTISNKDGAYTGGIMGGPSQFPGSGPTNPPQIMFAPNATPEQKRAAFEPYRGGLIGGATTGNSSWYEYGDGSRMHQTHPIGGEPSEPVWTYPNQGGGFWEGRDGRAYDPQSVYSSPKLRQHFENRIAMPPAFMSLYR